MKKYKLEEVCNIQIGKTPRREITKYWGQGHSWVSISDMKSKVITTTKEQITEAAIKECGCKLIPKGTILLSFKLSIGKLAFAGKDLFTNEAIVGLEIKNKDELNTEYLFYVLKNIPLVGSNNAAMGSTLNKESLRILKLPIPSLSDQIQIANILSKAETLIEQRKQSIALLDEFLKSTFLEMFGDNTSNQKKWKKIELKYFGEIITGNTPPRNNDENYSSNYIEWIKTDNIPSENTYITSAVEYLSESGLKYARTVESGALLVACIAGSIQSVGRAALTNRKISFNQQINAIQPNDEVESLFLYWLFKISRKYVQDAASNGMKKILTKGGFEKIKMIKPPIELQTQFASIVTKTETLKEQYKNSLQELENLYGSLSQKAFKGELEFKNILQKEMEAKHSSIPPAG